jgi:hypothetical protein
VRDETYKILIGKHDRKKLPGIFRHRWGIILEWVLEKYGEKCRLRIGTNG